MSNHSFKKFMLPCLTAGLILGTLPVGVISADASLAGQTSPSETTIAATDLSLAAVNTDSLLNKHRDISNFISGNLSTDTTLANNILTWQMPHGGFYKDMLEQYKKPWNGSEAKSGWVASGVELGTIDNKATVAEIRFLAYMYNQTGNEAYRTSMRKAVDFIIGMQYSSGGFPQVFPKRGNYSDAVTFNDDAMVRVMVLIDDIVNRRGDFSNNNLLTSTQRNNLNTALNKGVDYILKSQIVNNGVRTVWCAQHDPVTFAPVAGRAYELPSKSGGESVGIVAFLMSRPQTPEIRQAAQAALKWYDSVRVDGTQYVRRGPDYFVNDPSSVIWYRFYNVDDNKHFFADRDGQKYYDILQISEERRHGYAWAGAYARNLLQLASDSGYYTLSKPLP